MVRTVVPLFFENDPVGVIRGSNNASWVRQNPKAPKNVDLTDL